MTTPATAGTAASDPMPRREKLFGIDIDVLSKEEMLRERTAPEKPVQVCVRVADDPDASPISARHARDRQQLPCEECDALCWFDPEAGPGRLFVRLLCIQCLTAQARAATPGASE